MEQITITWEANVDKGTEHVDPDYFNCDSIDEWNALPEKERQFRKQEFIDGCNPCYAIVD